jgi:hypothetical protein
MGLEIKPQYLHGVIGGTMTGLYILWIDKVPAFIVLSNGEKDALTPTGWSYYLRNKEEVDKWIEKNKPA